MKNTGDYKIIFITHYKDLYGANRSLLNLIDGLLASGVIDLQLIAPCKGAIIDEVARRNVRYVVIPFINEITHQDAKMSLLKMILKTIYNWALIIWYARMLKEKGKKTVIHSNASATLIGAYFSYWLRIPHVWHIREFGMEDYKFKYNFGYRYFQYWLRKSKAAIAISKSIYHKRLKDEQIDRKEIIYNGVVFMQKLQQLKLLATQPDTKSKDKVVFGIIGFINKEKGQLEAIKAFNLLSTQYPNIELVIAGTGNNDYINKLKHLIKEYQLESKVRFTGFIDKVDEFYANIDFLLMCSRNEGLGRVTIEAMSHGIPVAGYDNGGTSEIIIHEYNGLLYSKGFAELFEMMVMFIENKAMVSTLKKNALKTVEEKFTIEAYSMAVYNVYQSL